MSYQNIFRIAAKNGVRDGADPLPLGAGMLLGSNLNGLAPYTNALQFVDFTAQSESWREFSGSGSYTIDKNDRVTDLQGDRVLSKHILVDLADPSLPAGVSMTCFFEGTGEFAVGNGTPGNFVAWRSAGAATWSHTQGLSIIVFVRGGTCTNLQVIETLEPNLLFRQQWLNFIASCNFAAIRMMDWGNTNGNMVRNWADRTEIESLTYSNTRKTTRRIHDYDGAFASTVPYEHMGELKNALDCHLWVCIPTRATEDYAEQMGALFATYFISGNQSLRLYLEYTNEPWNWTFSKTTTWINYLNANKRVATGTAGDNTATTAAHGLIENQQIVLIFHEQAQADPDGSTQLQFGPQAVRAINVTANTFDIVTDDGNNTPLNFDTDIEIVYWFPTSEHDASMDQTRIDRNYGARAVVLWDAFRTGWTNAGADVSRITEVINGQASFWQRTAEAFGPQGSNGRGVIGLAPYFASESSYQDGDGPVQMGAYDAARIPVVLQWVQDHITNVSANIVCYEGGDHWVPYSMVGGTIQDRINAVIAYRNSSQFQANVTNYLQGLADLGVSLYCDFVGDVNWPGQFGDWAMQSSLSVPDEPMTTVIKSYAGFVPQS